MNRFNLKKVIIFGKEQIIIFDGEEPFKDSLENRKKIINALNDREIFFGKTLDAEFEMIVESNVLLTQ